LPQHCQVVHFEILELGNFGIEGLISFPNFPIPKFQNLTFAPAYVSTSS
jgi:hypothetical protein